MHGQTSFDASKSSASPKGLTALLFGLIVCYQVVNQIFLYSVVSHEDVYFESDGACSAMAGGPSGVSCMEAKLFQGWRELPSDSPADLEQLLKVTPSAHSNEPSATTSISPSIPATGESSGLRGDTKLEVNKDSSTAPQPAQIKPESLEGGADKSHKAPEKQPHKEAATPEPSAFMSKKDKAPVEKTTSFAKGLTDLQQQLEAKYQAEAQMRAQHRALRALSVAARGESHEAKPGMQARKKEWDEQVAAHEDLVESVMKAKTQNSFMSEIHALGRELCQDPDRRDRPVCAQFLHPHPEGHVQDRPYNAIMHINLLEKHLHNLAEGHNHNHEEIQKESVDLLKELCADPARHSYTACARVLATTTLAPAVGNMRGSSLQRHALHNKVKEEAEDKPKHVDASQLVMHWKDLRGVPGAFWGGRDGVKDYRPYIPSVACVTVIPDGQANEELMRGFMDNYKLLKYEGAHELVLVYPRADKETARLVHLYTKGTSIRTAAFGGLGLTPDGGAPLSTGAHLAFRYGAWLARDADVVVRWDFEATHHPDRISIQVRAMTLSNRPASLITSVTVTDDDGNDVPFPGGARPHGSMVGKAAWMHKHWMPLLEEESTVLHGPHSGDVVQVAMPELLSYNADMLDVSQYWPGVAT